MAEELGASIDSSPRKGEDVTGTFRNSAAEKYWERLRSRGQASYDASKDAYAFSEPAKANASGAKEESDDEEIPHSGESSKPS
jgi:hypothetical protein